jgi:hypothetical protein
MATSNTPPSASAASSYILPSTHSSSPAGEISSLPSSDDDESTIADENQPDSDAEREWRESLQQLELLLTMVVVPFVGKYFGRKTAYWGAFTCIAQAVKMVLAANIHFSPSG